MIIAVPKESRLGETRVSLVPEVVKKLTASGADVVVESGAGDAATFTDQAYRDVGARIAASAAETVGEADVVAKVNAPSPQEVAQYREGTLLISFFQIAANAETLRALVAKRATVVSFDLLPRISRAQSMDALSSQALVSGYRAGLEAAQRQTKFFPMFMTAAGTIPPAKVLIMGVGVAGLQAIATAKRLGAQVLAYDVRSAAKEEAESLGAKFLDLGVTAEGTGGYARELSAEELAAQQAALAKQISSCDVVITTAAVPGRKAPILVTAAMVDEMGPGSVIVDMAADGGGNCEVSVAGEAIVRGHCTVVGLTNPPSLMPTHASALYSRNVSNLLELFTAEGAVAPDWTDEIVIGTTIVRDGEAVNALAAVTLGVTHQPITVPETPEEA